MPQQLAISFIDMPVPEPTERRRLAHSTLPGDETIVSRRDRLNKRNRLLVARYYYWSEIKRRRNDDIYRILSDNEFFVEQRTISSALLDNEAYYLQLMKERPSLAKLRKIYPGWAWS